MLTTHNLSIQYGATTVLRDVSLVMPAKQVTAIVGPSGCGKSSFLAALNRMTDLMPGASVTGMVSFNQQDVRDPSVNPVALRQQVGMVFQKPNPFPLSIERNITLAAREHGLRDRVRLEALVERVLRDVGLWDEVRDRLKVSALKLSGGQQQRLCIARALALQPQALLLDEPCSALDPIASATVERLIERLASQYTMVLVTHHLAQARRLADQLAVFWRRDGAGQLVESGAAAQVFLQPEDAEVAAYFDGRVG